MAHPPPLVSPAPRDLYLLALGVVAGVLLGPAVLGKLASHTYDRWFLGSGQARQLLDQFERQAAEQLDTMQATGVTGAALEELSAKHAEQRLALTQLVESNRRRHLDQLRAHVSAVVLALAVVMVLETLWSAQNRRFRWALSTARYALLAVWIALALAQPALLAGLPLGFLGLLLAVSLAAALVPLPGVPLPGVPLPGRR